jgi:predicted TIM-barrel fold metal-dependent hydrolase
MKRLFLAGLAATLVLPACAEAQRPTREPQLPPPTITEYTPESTLVVPENFVARSKFPTVDFHGHPRMSSVEDVAEVVAAMDALNLQVIVVAPAGSGESLVRQIEMVRDAGHADRFVFFASLNLNGVEPGSGARIAAQLRADVAAGAVGIGEIQKGFGLTTRKADGTRLEMDDPELDVVWETAAELGLPVFVHTGDPAEFFEPLDYTNERWLEMAIFPNRRFNDPERFPHFDDLMAERDRMIARHPNTTWVVAHMSWYTQDLGRLGELFDRFPNVYGELGAVLYDLGRQPRFAKQFFEQYQDRILFGKDSFQPSEYPYYWRVFETEDEYFDYYRDYHAFWKLYGMGLTDDVLRSIYYENALRIIPNMPTDGFPSGG